MHNFEILTASILDVVLHISTCHNPCVFLPLTLGLSALPLSLQLGLVVVAIDHELDLHPSLSWTTSWALLRKPTRLNNF